MINKCGCSCETCHSFQKECPGRNEVGGKPYWTQYIGGATCPVYACCDDKAYSNCGKCSALPCKLWFKIKDPSLSDEEHLRSIKERVCNLKEASGEED